MSHATNEDERLGGDLFDKYLLPKVALVVILVASFVGTVVSGVLANQSSFLVIAIKWVYLVVLGVTTGGLLWKHAFVRPADIDEDALPYCRQAYDRFDRIAVGLALVLGPVAGVVAWRYTTQGVDPVLTTTLFVASVSLAGGSLYTGLRERSVKAQYRGIAGLGTFVVAVVTVGLVATAEVSLAGRGVIAVGVRILHLLAFAAWVGGAVWNVFAAVPSGQTHPTTPVIRAAGEQLERFRWTVRLVIPTIVLTGLYQAYDALGVDVGVYVGSLVGLAILVKLGLIVVLVGIFLTCPMWRACSPIDGVCDLDDLHPDSTSRVEGSADD